MGRRSAGNPVRMHTHLASDLFLPSPPLRITKSTVAWLSFFPVGRTTGSGGFTFPAALGRRCAKSAQCSRPKCTCLDNAFVESLPCLQPSLGNQAGIWGSAASYVQTQRAAWALMASNHVLPAGGQRRGRNEGDAWGKRLSGELPERTELGRCRQLRPEVLEEKLSRALIPMLPIKHLTSRHLHCASVL